MIKYRVHNPAGGYYDVATPGEVPVGLTHEAIDISDKTNEINKSRYTELLQEKVTAFRIKAKGLAIGKTGPNDYILSQVEFYQNKYENAIAQNPISEIDADLQAEGIRDFNMSLSEFKELIKAMFLQGKANENLLMSFIEQGRSAILTLIEANQWAKVENSFKLIDNLNLVTTVAEARSIKNQILAL